MHTDLLRLTVPASCILAVLCLLPMAHAVQLLQKRMSSSIHCHLSLDKQHCRPMQAAAETL
jgi:hypothetical protein